VAAHPRGEGSQPKHRIRLLHAPRGRGGRDGRVLRIRSARDGAAHDTALGEERQDDREIRNGGGAHEPEEEGEGRRRPGRRCRRIEATRRTGSRGGVVGWVWSSPVRTESRRRQVRLASPVRRSCDAQRRRGTEDGAAAGANVRSSAAFGGSHNCYRAPRSSSIEIHHHCRIFRCEGRIHIGAKADRDAIVQPGLSFPHSSRRRRRSSI